MSSTRGRSTNRSTAPGRTQSSRRTGSPGETATSTFPAAQRPAGAEGLWVPPVVGAGAAGLLGIPLELPDEEADRDAPLPAPRPADAPHPTSRTTTAAAHPPIHHRIPDLPQAPPATGNGEPSDT
ncbi:hypothetical protein [Streptomyces sp. NPDC001340]